MTIWGWFLIGAASWAFAIILKVAADFFVQRSTSVALKDWAAAALSGVWSSVCELGLCAFAFWYWNANFAEGLVTATGAALAEFVMLLPAAISAHFGKSQGKAKDRANWSAFFLERALFFTNHISSRALLWMGTMGTAGFSAVAAALGTFALTEGTQAYGQAREWDWLNRRTQVTFFAFTIAIMATQIGLIIYWSRG